MRLVAHALHAALILRFVFPRSDAAQRRYLVQWWSEKLLRVLGVTLRVEGSPPRQRERSAMIAANHVSWLDIFVVDAAWPARFIAKSEIRDWPLAGWIAERSGTLFIRRERRRDAARMNERVHEVFAEGDCVGLFPEGTTTLGDRLLPFHSSLFEPAMANAAHVHPAAIRYEHADGSHCAEIAYVDELSFMESVASVIAQRGLVARLVFAEPLDCAVLPGRREATAAARGRIASLLGLPTQDSPPGTRADPPAAPR